MAVTETQIFWTESKALVALRDDVALNDVYGVGAADGEMTVLCVVIGDDVIHMAVAATTTYM